jgi:hypothetical protein
MDGNGSPDFTLALYLGITFFHLNHYRLIPNHRSFTHDRWFVVPLLTTARSIKYGLERQAIGLDTKFP